MTAAIVGCPTLLDRASGDADTARRARDLLPQHVRLPGLTGSGGANRRTSHRQPTETPERHQIERKLREPGSLRSLVFDGHRKLPAARVSHGAFALAAAQDIVQPHPSVVAVLRSSEQGSVLCLHAVSREPIDASALVDGPATDVITGERFARVTEILPYQTVWLTQEGQ